MGIATSTLTGKNSNTPPFSISNQPLIELQGVVRDVSGAKETTNRLLNNVSWQLQQGQRVGVISPSIREAHAFLDCAAGVVPVQNGQVTIHCNASWPLGARGGLLNSLTGRQNAAFLQGIYGHAGQRNHDLDVIQTIASLEDGFFDKPLRVYHKFMRTRFYLAVSLAFDFDAYIIPQIFALKTNEKSERFLRFQNALNSRTEDKPLIMANKDFSILQQYCEDGIVLHKGSIVYEGKIDECHQWYLSNIKDAPIDDSIDNEIEDESPSLPENDDQDDGDNAALW